MKQPPVQPKPDRTALLLSVFAVVVLMFAVVLVFTSTQRDIAEKQYRASLTPEERAALAEHEAQKAALEEQKGREGMESFVTLLGSPVPLWFVAFLLLVLAGARRHNW